MKYKCENNHEFMHTATHIVTGDKEAHEIPCCPQCSTYVYDELNKKAITSVISVDIAEVDHKLKEGYEVESLYAKTATLVKRE